VGGGVLIAVDSDFSSELICCLSSIEFVAIKLTVCQTSVYITCSYIPPQSELSVYLEHFSNIRLISSKLSDRDYLCVLGDFNLPDISWSSIDNIVVPSSSHEFVSSILDLSLYQVNNIRNCNNRLLT